MNDLYRQARDLMIAGQYAKVPPQALLDTKARDLLFAEPFKDTDWARLLNALPVDSKHPSKSHSMIGALLRTAAEGAPEEVLDERFGMWVATATLSGGLRPLTSLESLMLDLHFRQHFQAVDILEVVYAGARQANEDYILHQA